MIFCVVLLKDVLRLGYFFSVIVMVLKMKGRYDSFMLVVLVLFFMCWWNLISLVRFILFIVRVWMV